MKQAVLPDRKYMVPIVVALIAVAIVGLIIVTVEVARQQSLAEQHRKAAAMSAQVLMRAEAIRVEVMQSLDLLEGGSPHAAPCSPDKIRMMGDVVLTFVDINGAGFVAHDRLACTFASSVPNGFPVGPPSYVSSIGGIVRTTVLLPGAGRLPMLMVTRPSGFSVMLHLRLDRSVTRDDALSSFGIIGKNNGTAIEQVGPVDPILLRRYLEKGETSYVEHGQIVEIRLSATKDFAAFATMPVRNFEQSVRRYGLYVLLTGLFVVVLLALMIRYIIREEYSINTILRNAIRAREFYLEYQPIVELASGRWIGAEALLRWRRRTGEVIRPDFFIGAAEESGMIGAVTEMVFDMIATDLAASPVDDPDFYIAINVASTDLQRDRLVPLLRRLVERTALPPARFVVEATERGLIDAQDGRRALDAIRDLGFKVAIDDFGTGYSSLSYLQTFRMDLIKIDRLFVESMKTGAATSKVVSHIINMARDLDLQVVAEGVETSAQSHFLRSSGVTYAQGWLFARPMRWSALAADMVQRRTVSPPVDTAAFLPAAV